MEIRTPARLLTGSLDGMRPGPMRRADAACVRPVSGGIDLDKLVTIQAFTLAHEGTARYFPKDMEVRTRLSFGWPCEYNLDPDFIERLQRNPEHRLTIDFAGRNHGVDQSVYINTDEVVTYLKEIGIIPQ